MFIHADVILLQDIKLWRGIDVAIAHSGDRLN